MGAIAKRWSIPLASVALGAALVFVTAGSGGADATNLRGTMSDAAGVAIQIAGQGRIEEHPPGVLDGVRFEGRFSIFGIDARDGAVFGHDVSLFDPECVEAHGRGPQCAHFVAVRSGSVLEAFSTGDGPDFPGHLVGRTTTDTRLRIFFDPNPDGSRNYNDRNSFVDGDAIVTYLAQEYFGMDAEGGVFDTRVAYTLEGSEPVTFNGRTVDLGKLFPRLTELSHGHNPEPAPDAEPIPNREPWFSGRGAGNFVSRFTVNGTMLAVD